MSFGDMEVLNASNPVNVGTSTASTLHTPDAGKVTEVMDIIAHNPNASASVGKVFVGGTNAANEMFSDTIASGESLSLPPDVFLAYGTSQAIYMTATSQTLNVTLWGRRQS